MARLILRSTWAAAVRLAQSDDLHALTVPPSDPDEELENVRGNILRARRRIEWCHMDPPPSSSSSWFLARSLLMLLSLPTDVENLDEIELYQREHIADSEKRLTELEQTTCGSLLRRCPASLLADDDPV